MPIDVYNMIDGGPRPRAFLDEKYKQTILKVDIKTFLRIDLMPGIYGHISNFENPITL